MDSTKLNEGKHVVAASPSRFEIKLSDRASEQLAFLTPPIEDLREMALLRRDAFSLTRHLMDFGGLHEEVSDRLAHMLKKESRFGESAIFHNRIANLYAALGEVGKQRERLNLAGRLLDRPVFKRKIAESYLLEDEFNSAGAIFREVAGSSGDSRSMLGVAAACLKAQDFDGSKMWVQHALEISPEGFYENLFASGLSLAEARFGDAIRELRIALRQKPNSSIGYSNLAVAYLGIQNYHRAFSAFKKATVFDPFNKTALFGVADVGSLLDKDVDCIGPLRYFLQFEQRESLAWNKLARSYFKLGMFPDCVRALKMEGAIAESLGVWNNLGVCYAAMGKNEDARRAYQHALAIARDEDEGDAYLVARNSCQLVARSASHAELIRVTGPLVHGPARWALASKRRVADVFIFHLGALEGLGRREEAVTLSEELLAEPSIDRELYERLVSSLIGSYALTQSNPERLDELLAIAEDWLVHRRREIDMSVIGNNVAFAYTEKGDLRSAQRWMRPLEALIGKSPYATATLGLITFRLGDRERGQRLYETAIGLSRTDHDRGRIRQKLNLELARLAISEGRISQAQRFVSKVVDARTGEPVLADQARRMWKVVTHSFEGR